LAAGGLVAQPDKNRPNVAQGAAVGDVDDTSAVVWSRTDRPARLMVEYSTTEAFRDVTRVRGPAAFPEDDFTARVWLRDLPAGQTIFYRARFEDLDSPKTVSEVVTGRFRTAPAEKSDVTFAWSGDTVGQGWGINRAWGGLKMYDTIRKARPDFFVHSGDTIYADNPLPERVLLPDGTVWKNVVTPEKSKVAETLDEFRGNFLYNLLDDNLRKFHAEVPLVVQWDDHETRNNWYPGQILEDDRYKVKNCSLLSARANRAFREYMPIRPQPEDAERIYRTIRYGPLLEVFVIDMRSYRAPNSANNQKEPGDATAFLGAEQLAWLKRRLQGSKALWKVIASDMPLGLIIPDGPRAFEAVANGDDGPPLGRELETADLLKFLKANKVRNVVWLTADVHYAAAHYYDPERGKFGDFDGFWEFVAGPLHAGTFGPGVLDETFGPVVKFQSVE
jgi:alkaline phosphatase D